MTKEQGDAFVKELTDLQSDMLSICNEYSCARADKIFIYVAYEGLLLAQHFYSMNGRIYDCHKLNDAGLGNIFDVSSDCQGQVLDILNADIQTIKSVCDKYRQPMPVQMKIVYEPKTGKFNVDYKYENQTSDDVSVFDNYDAWFEEEKARLEN